MKKKGRPIKYINEDERKKARKIQNKKATKKFREKQKINKERIRSILIDTDDEEEDIFNIDYNYKDNKSDLSLSNINKTIKKSIKKENKPKQESKYMLLSIEDFNLIKSILDKLKTADIF